MKRYYDVPEYDAAFERFVGLMADLMVKYGHRILVRRMNKLKSMNWYPELNANPDSEACLRRLKKYSDLFATTIKKAA